MIRLVEPEERYLTSYQQACDEYAAYRIEDYSFTNPRTCNVLEKFDNYRMERNLRPDRVGAHFYWLVDDEKDYFIGEITIRHRLNEALMRRGGHIGYGVRRSEWGKGYGTLMLKLALEKAHNMGLDSILITCDEENAASARVMQKNGLILWDVIENEMDGRLIKTCRFRKQ